MKKKPFITALRKYRFEIVILRANQKKPQTSTQKPRQHQIISPYNLFSDPPFPRGQKKAVTGSTGIMQPRVNAPYASVTFDASALPDNRYHDLDVTELVQGYVNGTYNNTGFFLKAKDENDNYIAFYSSEWSNASQRPKLVINTSEVSFAIEDVNQDGRINQVDLDIIQNSINTNTSCQRCDVNANGIVDIYDVTRVSVKV